MEITVLGTALIILGYVGAIASLLTLAAVSPRDKSSQIYPVLRIRNVAIAAVTSILLVILGFVISDPRRISDSLALLILGGILVAIVAIVAILVVKAVVGVRGGGHKAWTVLWVAAPTLLAISTVWSGLADDDFTTSLIWSSFILPLLAAILALVWLLVTVIIRRGRRSALTFVGSAASLAVMGGGRSSHSGHSRPTDRDLRRSIPRQCVSSGDRLVARATWRCVRLRPGLAFVVGDRDRRWAACCRMGRYRQAYQRTFRSQEHRQRIVWHRPGKRSARYPKHSGGARDRRSRPAIVAG